jgi:hydrogenase nickel incorporation protein HypA/HybF
MHEMGIACSVLEAVQKELLPYPEKRAVRVALRIGQLAGVNTESLRFCFEAITKHSRWGPLQLEVEPCAGAELDLAYLEIEDAGEQVAAWTG